MASFDAVERVEQRTRELELELLHKQERLQVVNEKRESTSESLQSANEELMPSCWQRLAQRAFRKYEDIEQFLTDQSGKALFDYPEKPVHGDICINRFPHITVLDINIPSDDGFRLLEKLRADGRYRALRVVMRSTPIEHEDVRQAYERGTIPTSANPVP